jgi:hypothetical protein
VQIIAIYSLLVAFSEYCFWGGIPVGTLLKWPTPPHCRSVLAYSVLGYRGPMGSVCMYKGGLLQPLHLDPQWSIVLNGQCNSVHTGRCFPAASPPKCGLDFLQLRFEFTTHCFCQQLSYLYNVSQPLNLAVEILVGAPGCFPSICWQFLRFRPGRIGSDRSYGRPHLL